MPALPAGISSARRAGSFALVAVLATAAGLAVLVYRLLIVPAGPFTWDEGYHALRALRASEELREGSVLRLAYDAYRSVYWPPLHALYVGTHFLLFGASAEVARASSLPALLAAAGFLAAAALRARGATAALVAGFGFLLSPSVVGLSGHALLELPALALFALSICLYVGGRRPVLLGLSVFATFLARTNYGVLLALGLTVALAADAVAARHLPPGDPGRAARRDALRTLAALVVSLILWFAYPPKIAHTVAALVNVPLGPAPFTAEGLLFYPRAAVRLAGSGPLLAVYAAAVGLSLTARGLRDRCIRLTLTLVLLQALFAEVSHTKLARHILPLALLLPLLLGIQVSDAWTRGRGVLRAALLCGGALLLAGQGFAFAAVLTREGLRLSDATRDLILREAAKDGRTAFVASENAAIPPASCDFELVSRGILPLDGSGALRTASEVRAAERALPLPGPLARRLRAEAGRWPGTGSYSVYIGLPRGDAALRWTPENFPARFTALLARAPVDRVVALADPDGASFPVTPDLLEGAMSRLGFALESSHRPAPGTILLTFRRTGSPAASAAREPRAP